MIYLDPLIFLTKDPILFLNYIRHNQYFVSVNKALKANPINENSNGTNTTDFNIHSIIAKLIVKNLFKILKKYLWTNCS
jgi:hypothetical protein